MGLRPGRCYSRPARPYTRISITTPRKSYVVGVPASKITQFEMGTKKKAFDTTFRLVSRKPVQVRSNALEASRQVANKYLERTLTTVNYFFKVLVYPFQVLRENALATGAGADRFQEGMRKSFGKPIGTAAIIGKGQAVMELRISKNDERVGKEALHRAAAKLPMPCRILET